MLNKTAPQQGDLLCTTHSMVEAGSTSSIGAPDDPWTDMYVIAKELDAELLQAFDAIESIPDKVLGHCSARCGVSAAWNKGVKTEDIFEDVADTVARYMTKLLVSRFAVPGVEMRFSVDEVLRTHKSEIQEQRWKQREPMTPRECWIGMTATKVLQSFKDFYKPEQWRAEQCRHAANSLVRAFGLFDGVEPSTVSGRIKLETHIFTSTTYGSKTCHNLNDDQISKIAQATQCIGGQDGCEIFADFADDLKSVTRRCRSGFKSRERFELGDDAHLILYFSAAKFYLSPAMFETLAMFISEHADADVRCRQNLRW